MELRRVVLSLFLASVQSLIEIPPIDRYPLPPRLYNEHPDPSRTIIDASLNDDVLDWKQYEMEFMQQSRAPRGLSEELGEILRIRLPDGLDYECELPRNSTEKKLNERSEHYEGEIKKWIDALRPLGRKVLTHRAGWWTYDFTFQKHVKQYHEYKNEDKGTTLIDEYLLGRYVPGTSTEKLDFTGSKLIQEYIDGDICLLDNNRKGPPRTTQIHFKCNPILFDNIESVVELGTCSYVITVATPRVCHLASKLSHKSLIRCYPTAESSGKAFKKDFHSPPSDSEQTSELSEMERLAHKKWQHNMIVQVASASKLPIFTKLFNELATDIMDETIVGVIKSKSSSEHSTENSSDNNEKEEEPAEKKNEKNSNSESSSPSAPESEQSGSGDETKEPLDNTNLIRSL